MSKTMMMGKFKNLFDADWRLQRKSWVDRPHGAGRRSLCFMNSIPISTIPPRGILFSAEPEPRHIHMRDVITLIKKSNFTTITINDSYTTVGHYNAILSMTIPRQGKVYVECCMLQDLFSEHSGKWLDGQSHLGRLTITNTGKFSVRKFWYLEPHCGVAQ